MPSKIVYAADYLVFHDDRTGEENLAKNAMIVQFDTLEELQAAHDRVRAEEKLVISPQPARQTEAGVLPASLGRMFQAILACTSRPRQKAQD